MVDPRGRASPRSGPTTQIVAMVFWLRRRKVPTLQGLETDVKKAFGGHPATVRL